MNSQKALFWYAIAVGTLCLIAFLSNPMNALSALFSGVALVAITLGIRHMLTKWPDIAFWILVAFLMLVIFGLGYRAVLSWWKIFVDQGPKVVAALCISGIVFVSCILLGYIFTVQSPDSRSK